jgi:hypothetical protein
MIQRSKAQKIGSQGHKWALSQIENHPHWLARDLGNEDFGVDAEAELNIDVIKGEILKLQFKTSEHLLRKDGRVRIDIERKYVEYAESCRYPVILVRIDLCAKQAWYLWLQKWILEERTKGNKLPVRSRKFHNMGRRESDAGSRPRRRIKGNREMGRQDATCTEST